MADRENQGTIGYRPYAISRLLRPPAGFFQLRFHVRTHAQIEDLRNFHFALHFSRFARSVDDLSHVALLETPAGIVAAHFILIGFPRRLPVVDPQYFLNHVESFFRLLTEKQMPFQESSKKRTHVPWFLDTK